MDWLGNIGNAVGGFFNNLFGGNRDDEERKRRERERQQQQRQQQQARQNSAVQSTQNTVPMVNQQKGNDPFNINKHFGMQNQQNGMQNQENKPKPLFDLTLGKTNQRQANLPTKEEQAKIPGYKVMNPQAQQQAVERIRQQAQIKKNKDKEIEKQKAQENRKETAGLFVNSMAKVIKETPKDVANLPGLLAQGFDWVGDNSARAGQSFGQWLRNTPEDKREEQRAKLDVRLNNDTMGNLSRKWYTGIDDIAESIGLQGTIDRSDRAIQSNIDKLVKYQGKLTTGQAAIGAAGEVVGSIIDPTMLVSGIKGLTTASKLRRAAAVEDIIAEAERGTKAAKDAIADTAKGTNAAEDALREGADGFTPEQQAKIKSADATMAEQNKNKLPAGVKEDNLPVVSVKRADGTTQTYQPKTTEEFLYYNRMIDNTQTGIAGTPDANGDVWHITAGNSLNENIVPLTEAPKPAFDEARLKEALGKAKEKMEAPVEKTQEVIPEQKAQQAQQNSVKQGGGLNYDEMMATLQARRKTNQPAQDTRAASIQKEAPIDSSREALAGRMAEAGLTNDEVISLTNQYQINLGEWRALMNRLGSLEKANSRPAVVVSELKKLRSEGVHGQSKAAMNNDVTAQRLSKEAEEATPVTQTEGGAVVDAAKNQPVRNQNVDMTAERFIDDINNGRATFDDVPPSLRREVFDAIYGGEGGRVVDTPAGKTDVRTGEIVDDAPDDLTLVEQYQRELNEKATAYINEVRAIEEAVERLGFEPQELRRKAQAANRNEYKMTDEEATAHRLFEDRLNQARLKGEEEGLVFEGNQIHYSPQVREGEVDLPKTREDLMSFGYGNQRTNAIGLDELDYGEMPLVDYLMRAENRNLQIKQSMAKAAEVDGRPVTREGIEQAAKDTEALQKKVKDSSKSEKVLNNDTVEDLNKIGLNEGYDQVANDTVAGKLAQEPMDMLQRAEVYDRGFEQFDNTVGYAHEFTRQAVDNKIPPQQLEEAMTQAIRKAMPNADQSAIQEAVGGAIRRIENRQLTGTDIAPQVASAFRSAAKSELFKLGKTTKFTDKKMKAVVNEQINARLMQDAYSKNFAQELDSFIAQRINASLRGMNIISAAFEFGDVANILSNYGVKNLKKAKMGFGKVDGETFGMSRKYGETSSHFLSADLPEVKRLDEVWDNPNTNIAQKLKQSYEVGENKLLIFRYVEQYKTELFFRQADNYWRAEGLQGTELVNQVMHDYHKTMLPNKIITANRILGKLPKSLTQYLNWSVQATKRLGRTLAGTNDAGIYRDMGRGSRIVRGATTELAPKVAIAALLGVPIQQVLGMRDWTGMTDGDFSGIPEEEKNALDHIMGYVGMSPALGIISNAYYAGRRNEIAATDDNDRTQPNDNWLLDSLGAEASKLIPFYTQINKTFGVQDGVNKGYFENKDGRVQYEAPEAGSLDHLLGLITGKTYLRQNRDYSDNPDLISVLQGKASLGDLFTHNQTVDNLVQSLGGETARDYERPVSNNDFIAGRDKDGNLVEFNYNDWVKEQYESGRDKGGAALAKAKEYNEALDSLRRDNPDVYKAYTDIMDDKDLVSPERWAALTGTNSEGGFDLTLVKMMGDRKKAVAQAAAEALGKPEYAKNYDPMYDLDDEQLRSVLQQKSTATGDDIALRNVLYKEEWYQKYMAESRQYYDQKLFSDEDFGNTERVNKWNDYNTSLSQLSFMQPSKYDSEEVLQQKAALREQFPYNAAYQAVKNEYEDKTGKDFYGSEESKQWYAQYGDGKKAEDEQLDAAKLTLINQMREIEGHPPMSAEAYAQATNIVNTSGGGGGGRRSRGGRRGGGDDPGYSFVADFTQPGITWKDIVSVGSTSSKPKAFKPNTSVGRRTNSKKRMGAGSRGTTA